MHEILPGETAVAVHPANQSIVLSGTVSSPAVLKQVLDLAETYDPGKVVNMMTVQGTQQVMLSVRFVEMERTAAKNLGLNTQLTPAGSSPQVSVNSGDALNFVAASALNTFGSASLLWKVGGGDLSFLVRRAGNQGTDQDAWPSRRSSPCRATRPTFWPAANFRFP